MDKQNVAKTQCMWKDYPNTKFWIDTISNPSKHMFIENNQVIGIDNDYKMAIESLCYILLGELFDEDN